MKTQNKYLLVILLFIMNLSTSYAFDIINCNTIECIQNALSTAAPGDEIVIASGVYEFSVDQKVVGAFGRNAYLHAAQNGTSSNRIIVRGESAVNRPVIQGVNYEDGYLFSLEGNYWTIKDIEFRRGSKGIMLDNADYTELINLEIHDVADEGLHFRHGTTNSVADGCYIHDTGKVQPQFGEGIYIGSDRKTHNNEASDIFCSDAEREAGRCGRFYNPVVNNITIKNCILGPNVTAEHLDIKEGTCNVFIEDNTFNGTGIVLTAFEDSFIDLKGGYSYVRRNTFNRNGNSDILRGIMVIDRDNGEGVISLTANNHVVHDNVFNMDDTNTPAFVANSGSVEIYGYNNIRNPDGIIYGSSRINEENPNWEPTTCDNTGNQDSVLSINEYFRNNIAFIIAPNPVHDILEISGQKNIKSVTVYSLQGQKIFTNKSARIDVSDLAVGSYLITIRTDEGVGTRIFNKM